MIELGEHGEIIFKERDAFAAYSLPGSTDHTVILGSIRNVPSAQGSFLIQRFDKENKPALFLEANVVRKNASFRFDFQQRSSQKSTIKNDYLMIANETIAAIRTGIFKKVVISKIKVVSLHNDIRSDGFFELFEHLKKMYPKAFVFIYHLPGEGCWCGATPEVLLDASTKVFKTMALAGTQSDTGLPLNQVKWGDKEVEEQRIIEEYVEDILDKSEITATKIGPSTMKAGSVFHIKSTYEMSAVDDPIKLAEDLHPGPAICGIPLESSLEWIKDHEDHNREHYCGYIGPWNIAGQSILYINLRSMRIYNNQLVLFLGGGLTSDSNAMSEWEETELKAQTLMSAIEKMAING